VTGFIAVTTVIAVMALTTVTQRSRAVPRQSDSGGGRGEAIRIIYYSDRQLPPGHDPGSYSGEAHNGRERGSRTLDILVECHSHLWPRREVRTRHDVPAIEDPGACCDEARPAAWLTATRHFG
jgi:hypothetical protein